MSDTQSNGAILARMQESLDAYVAGGVDTNGFVQSWRQAAESLVLPPPYGAALDDLLRRLQMSAVFAQDSCSFSASAITDQMIVWLRKAGQAK
ncbi:hypothetical protein CURE108131_11250 [Cupriavidus respiraculi]|uniref:Uncharacterized protein n=1 Tax=Cupriavidus respiraculi TaxID=195930 RepID=A0ABM8WX71_9BURK|nr:hypothetical protein [Cupriavidus respiraculi]CAG9172144.1 hypothetical protein LMG21510_01873 [Cupriavidus respiraculi]